MAKMLAVINILLECFCVCKEAILSLSLSPTVCSLNWSWESRTTSLTAAHTPGSCVGTAANTTVCVSECVWERKEGRHEL